LQAQGFCKYVDCLIAKGPIKVDRPFWNRS
jgi:hypothetical protein